jgi:hypothetical protein
VFFTALGLTLGLCAPAFAQLPACKGAGLAQAAPITPPLEGARNQVYAGVITRPLQLEAAGRFNRTITCTRGEPIAAGGLSFTLTGEDEDSLPRRAIGAGERDPSFYLYPDVDMGNVLAAMLGGQRAINVNVRYVLVRVTPEVREVIAIYPGMPTDVELRRIIAENAATAARPQARIEVAGGGVTILAPSISLPLPQGQSRRLTQADGTVFERGERNAVKHKPTGFVCPQNLQGLVRRDLAIYDPSDGGRDVSCGYGRVDSPIWHTLYLTKVPDLTPDQVFTLFERDAQMVAPPTNAMVAPLAPGAPPLPARASFWVDRYGMVQGLWVTSVGPWHIKIRTTCERGRESQAAQFARAAFEAVYSALGSQAPAAAPATQ